MPDSQEKSRIINATLFEKLGSADPTMVKEAVDAVNDFTRIKIREDSFADRILPPLTIGNDDLDRVPYTDKPLRVEEREPDSPAAVSVPFGTLPLNFYIRGSRYVVMFDRILTPRFTKDIDELRTYVMDIRQVLADNAIKDMLAELDGKFIAAVNACLVGQDTVVPWSGVVQWKSLAGGITRETLWEMKKILPSTPSNLEPTTALVNNITINDIAKFGRNEMGGDMAQDVMRNGWSEQTFMGMRWIITIKKTIVPTNNVYLFADPKFVGKSYELEPATTYIKREAYLLEFFSYMTRGGSIGNSNAVARATFV